MRIVTLLISVTFVCTAVLSAFGLWTDSTNSTLKLAAGLGAGTCLGLAILYEARRPRLPFN